jgi:hypothetical protein
LLGEASLLAQEQVHDPAAPHMLPRLAAEGQDVRVVATSFLQSVGQVGQAVEGPLVVDRAGQFDHAGYQPTGIDSNGPDGVSSPADNPAKLFYRFEDRHEAHACRSRASRTAPGSVWPGSAGVAQG